MLLWYENSDLDFLPFALFLLFGLGEAFDSKSEYEILSPVHFFLQNYVLLMIDFLLIFYFACDS